MTQSAPPEVRIAPCETVAECHACEDLQTAVWGGGEREIIPYDILRAIGHAGGTVLGAWDGARIVGMALSFVAWGARAHTTTRICSACYRSIAAGASAGD